MHEVERAAEISVSRGVGFAGLAVATATLGFAYEPALAFLVGAAGALLVAVVLELKAQLAPHRSYRRTEVWLMLEPPPAWNAEVAQRLIAGALVATLRRYARICFAAAVALWLVSLALRFSGF